MKFKFLITLILFLLIYQPLVKADAINFNDAFPYKYWGESYIPGYCTTTFETLSDDTVYLCKRVKSLLIPKTDSTPLDYGRAYCWNYLFNASTWGADSSAFGTGVVFSVSHDFSISPPQYDSNKVCVKKSEISPSLTCDLNIRSIINGAFSNKFPLDLFANFVAQTIPNACPSFTIDGQVFQLCYINALVKSLKYVLLLVFIIGSVIAL